MRFFLICAAGAAGTGLRYLVGGWLSQHWGSTFGYGTLAVNLVGSFLIAAVMELAIATAAVPPNLRVVLTTGFLGGLTTYSSFNYETVRFLQERAPALAALNVGVTVVGCLLCGWAGVAVGRLLSR